MEYRKYKEEKISLLGFGCMRLPLIENTNKINEILAKEMFDYAINHGINYFDTAYMYHEHQSEEFVGKALSKYPRNSFNLATKMPVIFVESEKDVERIFNEQLKKCKVEYFDYYLLHNINLEHLGKIEKYKIYQQIKQKQKEGKIRHLGFSFHDNIEVLKETIKRYEWEFAQIQLNYFDWEQQKAKEQYEILTEKEIPVIIMEPVRGGSLAKLPQEAELILKTVSPDKSIASWAIRFAASLPNVITVLSGMSNFEQVEDNIETISNFKPLTENERKILLKALEAYRKAATIPCTACRYCMDCPSGVDIPKNLSIYNSYLVRKSENNPMSKFLFEMECRILKKEELYSNCIKCNLCLNKCPQHINIPQWLNKIIEFSNS
ncbi:MAG: aldo/keto reductase [Bacteroidales bacterium]|jgi:predicted aldo/keto reductase-like oxidoreductase|nr:aldo/keto reductase [Bacteroidales bacterium]